MTPPPPSPLIRRSSSLAGGESPSAPLQMVPISPNAPLAFAPSTYEEALAGYRTVEELRLRQGELRIAQRVADTERIRAWLECGRPYAVCLSRLLALYLSPELFSAILECFSF